MKKTFASKEEQKAYYKARQQKENARAAVAASKDQYDMTVNVAGIAPELLAHSFTIEVNSLAGSFPSTSTLGEYLAADGQVSQRFWREWKGEDAYGLMRGSMSFKSQVIEAGISVRKLADGRWTLTLNGINLIA